MPHATPPMPADAITISDDRARVAEVAGEFAAGHIAGAVNIDIMAPDFEKRVAALDRGKTYLVYCQSGGRSGMACDAMHEKLKFPAASLYNLDGGIADWKDAGEPVEK